MSYCFCLCRAAHNSSLHRALISGDRSDAGWESHRWPGTPRSSHRPTVSVVAGPSRHTVSSRAHHSRASGKHTLSVYAALYHRGSNTYLSPPHTPRTADLANSPARSTGAAPRIA
uniref:Uncharacterized protein n=1 Tax=Oryza glumipatula TaxID=40148 RepID=A0A0D9ZK15_9ORYZ